MENQAYISHVHLKGYKSIRDMEVDLLPGLNIIIGPNGSGKTNFLECLDENAKSFIILDNSFFYLELTIDDASLFSLSRTFESRFKDINNAGKFIEEIYHNNQLLNRNEGFIGLNQNGRKSSSFNHWSTIESFKIPMSILASHNFIKYGYKKNLFMFDKYLSFNSKNTNSTIVELAEEGGLMLNRFISILTELTAININNVNNKLINNIFQLEQPLQDAIVKFTPVKDIRLQQDFTLSKKDDSINVNSLIFEFLMNNQWLTWKQLSDGTKRIIQIIFEVFTNENPFDKIVFIEEPELGIHPHQLDKLMDFFREQSQHKQIIITTHSPQVLNELRDNELDRIYICTYDAEKGTQIQHLSEDDRKYALEYMHTEGLSLSDYWVHSGFKQEEGMI